MLSLNIYKPSGRVPPDALLFVKKSFELSMSQLQLRQSGLYLDSFLPHSSSYEPANESISILKFPDFRFGPDNTIDFNALPKSKQKVPVAGSGHLACETLIYFNF
jgi:hypothetical protein